jgi:hypothetical protein
MKSVNKSWGNFIKSGIAESKKTIEINKDSKILAMGSCFAVEIRKYLLNNSYNVLPKNLFGFIWYTPRSIEQEVLLAFGEKTRDERDIWKTRDEKIWQDPYRRFVFANSKKEIMEKIHLHDKVIKEAFESADTFIFTMGLTEAWSSSDSNMALCIEPISRKDIKTNPGVLTPLDVRDMVHNAKFTRMNYESCLNSMNNIARVIKKHKPNAKIIMTTSPVPLKKTYREDVDVAVANCESKSIIRAAMAEAVSQNDNIIYFPSYETVTFMGKEAFRPDLRHVLSDVVEKIMNSFLDNTKKK